MNDSIQVSIKDLGLIEGLQTYEVTDLATGQVIGYNQTASEVDE